MAIKRKDRDKLHKKIRDMAAQDKLYGTTTIGARGQIVIPAEARKDLGLEPGDHLVVMGKMGKALGLMKVDQMQQFVKVIMEHLSGTAMEKEAGLYLKQLLGRTGLK